MLKIQVVCIGKLKENYLAAGCAEYLKRLSPYAQVSIVELPEYRLPQNPSYAQIQEGLEEEGRQILLKILPNALVISLCIEGKMLSSEELSEYIAKAQTQGNSAICFVIGGALGLSGAVKQKSALCLSMSRMTFPHQLARMLLLEQIYRAMSILNHAKYHK